MHASPPHACRCRAGTVPQNTVQPIGCTVPGTIPQAPSSHAPPPHACRNRAADRRHHTGRHASTGLPVPRRNRAAQTPCRPSPAPFPAPFRPAPFPLAKEGGATPSPAGTVPDPRRQSPPLRPRVFPRGNRAEIPAPNPAGTVLSGVVFIRRQKTPGVAASRLRRPLYTSPKAGASAHQPVGRRARSKKPTGSTPSTGAFMNTCEG